MVAFASARAANLAWRSRPGDLRALARLRSPSRAFGRLAHSAVHSAGHRRCRDQTISMTPPTAVAAPMRTQVRSDVMKLRGASARFSPWAIHTSPARTTRPPITTRRVRTQESYPRSHLPTVGALASHACPEFGIHAKGASERFEPPPSSTQAAWRPAPRHERQSVLKVASGRSRVAEGHRRCSWTPQTTKQGWRTRPK
jgi:hypothetical protein